MESIQSYLNPLDWAAALSKALSAPVRVKPVSREEFERNKPPGGIYEELWQTIKYFYDHPNLRGKPEDSLAILEPFGFQAKSIEEVFKSEAGWHLVD